MDLDTAREALAGVWTLVEYEDRARATDAWTQPYGRAPQGVAVYHPHGLLSMQIFAVPPATNPSFGYFGTYVVREARTQGAAFSGVVEHHLIAATDPTMLEEPVERLFTVSGDDLMLGDDVTWRRTFVRQPFE